ncbi:hypothetical protein LTR50_004763 [Elasticomyces elasticus]|nr:hypothetical protein LTR50_004763 [Elasticomyces elasticus]
MDKLERTKNENAGNDAILDDVAASAYIEQFALETFERADDAVRANKASRQVADTFQAAATFLDLMNIWAPVDQEITSKSKYAKYHALRIAKALKAGEDPNLSNPVVEEEEEEEAATSPMNLDVDDSSLQPTDGTYRAPTVESAPESKQPSRPASTLHTPPPAPPPMHIQYDDDPVDRPPNSDTSPTSPGAASTARQPSIGGGYFPSIPTSTYSSSSAAPTASPSIKQDPPAFTTPSDPQAFYRPAQSPHPTTLNAPAHGYAATRYRSDDESVAEAQRHCRWAVSALNFEDVETAVKELRLALGSLGAG